MLAGVSASSHPRGVDVPAHVAVPAVSAWPVPLRWTGRGLTTCATAAGEEAAAASCVRQPDRLPPIATGSLRRPDPAVPRRTDAVRDHRVRGVPVPAAPAPPGSRTTATTHAMRGGNAMRLPGVPQRPLELDA